MEDQEEIRLESGRPYKRTRVSRACEACRTKKIKCEGSKPSCENCRANGLECVYTESRRKPKAKKPTAGDIESRLGRLETMIETLNERLGGGGDGEVNDMSDDEQGETSGSPNLIELEQPYSHDEEGGVLPEVLTRQTNNYYSNGTDYTILSNPGLKWISETTCDATLPERLTQLFNEINEAKDSRDPFFIMPTTPEPPSHELMEFTWKVLSSETGTWDYFIPLVEIRALMQAVYNGDRLGYGQWLLLFSTCTIAILLVVVPNDVDRAAKYRDTNWTGDEIDKLQQTCCSSSIYYLNRVFLTPPSVPALRGIVLLIVSLRCINFYPISALCPLAARFAIDLGLHRKENYRNKSRKEAECLRRLFWGAYAFDREEAMRHGRIPCMMDFDISAEYPTPISDKDGLPVEFGVHMSQLMSIYGDVYESLYSVKATENTTDEVVKNVSRLDQALIEWRESIPPEYRPGGDFINRSFQNWEVIPPKEWYVYWDVIHLHLGYYYLLSTIHQITAYHPSWVRAVVNEDGVSNPSTPNDSNNSGVRASGRYSRVCSSMEICVSSARSTVQALETAAKIDSRFLGPCMLYSANAFTTLFIKCLARPKDLSTLYDLDVMATQLELFEYDAASGNNPSVLQQKDDPNRNAVNRFWSLLHDVAKSYVQNNQSSSTNTTQQQASETPPTQPHNPMPLQTYPTSSSDNFFQNLDSYTTQSLYQFPSYFYTWELPDVTAVPSIPPHYFQPPPPHPDL
jgi:hypothetical protein